MSRRGKGSNSQGGIKTDLVQAAVSSGIEEISKKHPGLSLDYMGHHVDQGKLRSAIKSSYKEITDQGGNMSKEDMEQALYQSIHNYVAEGSVFDDAAQKVILLQGRKQEPGFLEKIASKMGMSKKGDGIDKVQGAFNDLYDLVQGGGYTEDLAGFANSVKAIKDARIVGPALDILRSYDILDDKKYFAIKKALNKKVEEEAYESINVLESYATQKAAAAVIGVVGAGILFASAVKMTGNVVSSSATALNMGGALVGLGLLVAGLIMFSKSSKAKKSKAKKSSKKNKRKVVKKR